MSTQQRPRLSWMKRSAVVLAAVVSALGVSVAESPVANAAVYNSCTIAGCADAASANSTWSTLGYPTSRGWYDWPGGQCNFAGGQFYNYEGQLPAGDTFYEYDVYPRACDDYRDAYRIVVDFTTGAVWYSPNHYTDFYRL